MNPCNQNEEKCEKNQNRFETLRLVFRVIAVMQALCLPQNLRRSFLLTFLSICFVRYSFCVAKVQRPESFHGLTTYRFTRHDTTQAKTAIHSDVNSALRLIPSFYFVVLFFFAQFVVAN